MNDRERALLAAGIAALVLFLVFAIYMGIASDAEQCRETGMHRVCKNWILTDVGGATIMQCTQWEVEPCK